MRLNRKQFLTTVGRGAAATVADWSVRARTHFYANPIPDGFYSGSSTPDASGALRQNYYAFEWGDALFVVLDPFAYTPRKLRNLDWTDR